MYKYVARTHALAHANATEKSRSTRTCTERLKYSYTKRDRRSGGQGGAMRRYETRGDNVRP